MIFNATSGKETTPMKSIKTEKKAIRIILFLIFLGMIFTNIELTYSTNWLPYLNITGTNDNDRLGSSVSLVGDVNGDGYNDIIAASGSIDKAYIYFGGPLADNVADVVLDNDGSFDSNTASSGNVNGDAFDDVILGNPGSNTAYVYFGGSPMDNVVDVTLGTLNHNGNSVDATGDVNGDGFNDIVINGGLQASLYYGGSPMDGIADLTLPGDPFGFDRPRVSFAGDVNGDGYDDVLVGSDMFTRAYLYYGGSPMDDVIDIVFTDADCVDQERVSSAGDVNNDGFDDILLASPWEGIGVPNWVYLYYGSATMDSSYSNLDADLSFTSPDWVHFLDISYGNINGDVYSDIIISDTNKKKAHIYYGEPAMDNIADVTINGTADLMWGWSTSLGDFDQYGFDEIVIGSQYANASGIQKGQVYVYHYAPTQTTWLKTYDETGYSIIPRYIQPTSDDGYIVVGERFDTAPSFNDILIMKIDSAGTPQWTKTFGETGFNANGDISSDAAFSVLEDSNAYIIAGDSRSFAPNNGKEFTVIKTDLNGNKIWIKTFDNGASTNNARAIIMSNDDYIIIGSSGGNLAAIKLDNAGDLEWVKTYTTGNLLEHSADNTTDGGYVFASRIAGTVPGDDDGIVIKVDSAGEVVWAKAFGEVGGNKDERFRAVKQTSDGGYIAVGHTTSFSATDTTEDIFVVKLFADGTLDWARTLYDNDFAPWDVNDEKAFSVIEDPAGGYIIIGQIADYSATDNPIIIKLDTSGNKVWAKISLNVTTLNDEVILIQNTNDGNFIATGTTGSKGFIFKFNSSGNIDSCDTIYPTDPIISTVVTPSVIERILTVSANTVTGTFNQASIDLSTTTPTFTEKLCSETDTTPPTITIDAKDENGDVIIDGGVVVDDFTNTITLTSIASDTDGSVTEHNIRYWIDGVMQPVSTWATGGTHTVTITGPLALETIITYRAEAEDDNANTVTGTVKSFTVKKALEMYLTLPVSGTTYSAGDTLTFSGIAISNKYTFPPFSDGYTGFSVNLNPQITDGVTTITIPGGGLFTKTGAYIGDLNGNFIFPSGFFGPVRLIVPILGVRLDGVTIDTASDSVGLIASEPWSQAGQNAQHTGYSPLIGTSNLYGIKWSRDLGIGNRSASPVSVDVNGDGKDEIIVMGTRLVYDENGNNIWGAGADCLLPPWIGSENCSEGSIDDTSSPSIGDIDGDGNFEVVGWREKAMPHLYAKDAATGNMEWYFGSGEVYTDLENYNRQVFPVLSDIDGDGAEEILISGSSNLYVLDGSDGSIRWKATVPGGTYTIPAVGDINDDGINEVVLEHRWDLDVSGQGDESVKAWDLNGNELWSKNLFPNIGGSYIGYTVLADVDQTILGLEVIVEVPGTLYILNGNSGDILWQKIIEEDISNPYPTWSASPAIADVDDDGKLEIIVPTSLDSGDKLMVLNGEDGSLVWKIPLGGEIWIAPVVADLDNDGKEEIVVAARTDALYIINAEDGSIRQSIPIQNYYHYMAISDVDGDNEAEILVVDDNGILHLLDEETATLTVTLTATPNSGTEPLNNVDLGGTVAGTATGAINYTFDCDTTTPATNHTKINEIATTYNIANLCNYSTAGTYTTKVNITRDGQTAEDTTTITVTSTSTLTVTLTATPNYGTAPLNNIDLEANVGGTATGNIDYEFDCDITDGTTDHTATNILNPYTTPNLCNYPISGTYTARVNVTRQGQKTSNTRTITVTSAPAPILTNENTLVRFQSKKVTLEIDNTDRGYIIIKNPTDKYVLIPLHIGSPDESFRNAIQFEYSDLSRHDKNVTLKPNEEQIIPIKILAGKIGTYELVVGPDDNYINRYDSKFVTIVHKKSGIFSGTPDLRWISLIMIILIAAIIRQKDNLKTKNSKPKKNI